MVLTAKRAWVAAEQRFVDIVDVDRVISKELLQAFRDHFSTGVIPGQYFHIYATLREVEAFYLDYLRKKYSKEEN